MCQYSLKSCRTLVLMRHVVLAQNLCMYSSCDWLEKATECKLATYRRSKSMWLGACIYRAKLPGSPKQCAMEASQSGHLCGGVIDYSHHVALFSMSNTKKDLHVYLEEWTDVLGVPVRQNDIDGHPTMLCKHCMNKFSALERELESLKQKTRATYNSLPNKKNVGSRKRKKH